MKQMIFTGEKDLILNKQIRITDKYKNQIQKSQKRLGYGLKISKKQKKTILRYITKDLAYNLSQYIEKKAIKFDTQVGMEGYGWNFLHISAKMNASQCSEFILKQIYHQGHEEFNKYICTQTIEGYTAIMIAILYQSIDVLKVLVNFGAVEMGMVNNKKLTAYEMALNLKNQKAIRLLMIYQQQSRKQKSQIKQKLQQPMIFTKRQEGCCLSTFMAMFDFVSFGCYDNFQYQQTKMLRFSQKKISIFGFDSFQEEQVKISRQISHEAQYQIQWKEVNTIITNFKYSLYQNYNPFDISQKNIVLKNNLILLQSLSSHPWLVRKIVQIDRSKQDFYNIKLFISFQENKINISNFIPILKDRQKPMFIENQNEIWPMMLQKGLAKAHGSYFDLDQLQPTLLVEELTGFPTFEIYSDHMQNLEIFNLLRQIHRKGYFYILQGKQGSNLSNQGKKDCFSVLQFFEKNQKKLVLFNCPFVDFAWKQKQKYEMHSLKLIKSHFNSYDQMSVWVQMQRLKQYFSKIIVSTILPNYERKSFKAKVKNSLFFTFKVNREREQKMVFQLINLENKCAVPIQSIRGYLNEGSEQACFSKGIDGQNWTHGVFSAQNKVGQYLCYINIDKGPESIFTQENVAESIINSESERKHQKYMLLMWSVDGIEPQYLDESLGPVDYLIWVKVSTMKNWNENEIYRLEIASDYALILIKDRGTSSKTYVQLEIQRNDLIEGKIISDKKIQMTRYEDEDPFFNSFFFCIIRNASKYHLQKKSSFIKDSANQGPAGQVSTQPKLIFLSQ